MSIRICFHHEKTILEWEMAIFLSEENDFQIIICISISGMCKQWWRGGQHAPLHELHGRAGARRLAEPRCLVATLRVGQHLLLATESGYLQRSLLPQDLQLREHAQAARVEPGQQPTALELYLWNPHKICEASEKKLKYIQHQFPSLQKKVFLLSQRLWKYQRQRLNKNKTGTAIHSSSFYVAKEMNKKLLKTLIPVMLP